MAKRKQPVSTAAIRREIKKTLAKLKSKKKTAKASQVAAINTEIHVLTKVDGICGDIRGF